jgi:hypothetical protein
MPVTAMALVYDFLFLSTHFDVEKDEELMIALSIVLLSMDLRGDAIHRQCLNWCRHVRSLQHQGLFWLYYRMHYEAFTRHLHLLQNDLAVNSMKSRNQTSNKDPIGPKLTLNCKKIFGWCFLFGCHGTYWHF